MGSARRERRAAGRSTVLAGLLLAALALVASDAAALRVATRIGDSTIPSGTVGATGVKCPKGTRAISGGFLDAGFDFSGPRSLPTAGRRAGSRRWVTDSVSFGAGAAHVTAFVNCVESAKIGVRSKERPVPDSPGPSVPVTATCPKGTRAVSGGFVGGFDFGPGADVLIPRSKRVGSRGWGTSFFNDGGAAGSVTALAYCLPGSVPLVRTDTTSIGQSGTGTATATCPTGTKAISGGFDGEGSTTDPTLFAFSSYRAGTRVWRVDAANFDNADPRTLTAFAYCA